MAAKAKAIPEGFRTITPHLIIKDAGKAIDFYKKAFGAEEIMRMPGPDGKSVMHAELKIGDSVFMMCDENPQWDCKGPKLLGGTPVNIHLYVADCDKIYNQAIKAGGTATMPLQDMFWGDRYGKVTDPFGHIWAIATHKEEVSPQECAKRASAWFANMGCKS